MQIKLELTPAHIEFLMLALHRMACRGDEVVANVECRQILSRLHKQLAPQAPAQPAKPEAEKNGAKPEAAPRDAVSQALAELNGAKPEAETKPAEPENRAARRRREKAAKGD